MAWVRKPNLTALPKG